MPSSNSTVPSSGADSAQKRQILQMGGLGKEINRLELLQPVRALRLEQPFQIPGLGCHVATEVGQQAWWLTQDCLSHAALKTSPWWIDHQC